MNQTTDALSKTAAFWRDYYTKHQQMHAPSPFAQWCLEKHLPTGSHVLEFGCGNGRDSFAFLQAGIPVVALDGCEAAIAVNEQRRTETKLPADGAFVAKNFAELSTLTPAILQDVNVAYSRFVLHAVPEELEDAVLDYCWEVLPSGGHMLHEFRTLQDPLMQKGEALSSNERLTDHYRRFIDAATFRQKLQARKWQEVFFVESNGLAVFGEEDPVVARVVSRKP